MKKKPALPLYPYQLKWLKNKSRFKVGMFCRQAGKTFTSTLDVVDDCMEADAKGRKTRWVILSRGERQAKEAMLEGVHRHLQAYGLAFEAFEYDWGDEVKYKALEVVLPGGSRITALPANPDTARGFSANVLLDEFAFHADSRKIWKALFPVISNGYRLIVVSTPNGKNNKFYEIMTSTDPIWYRQTVDIYQAVADGLPRNIEELRRALDDEDAWEQEFELHWLDEASAWLPYELIDQVEDPDAGRPELYEGGICYGGEDIGLRRDLWVSWVSELVGNVLVTREIRELERAKFAAHDAARAELFRTYRIGRWCMDQTGMGEKPVEDTQRLYGAGVVEGVQLTGPNKLTLATLGKTRFEDRSLRIPAGRPELRRNLHKIEKILGPTGIPRFVAERDQDGHADRTWACFLMVAAATTTVVPIEFQATGEHRHAWQAEAAGAFGTGARTGALTETGWGTVRGALDLRGYR